MKNGIINNCRLSSSYVPNTESNSETTDIKYKKVSQLFKKSRDTDLKGHRFIQSQLSFEGETPKVNNPHLALKVLSRIDNKEIRKDIANALFLFDLKSDYLIGNELIKTGLINPENTKEYLEDINDIDNQQF